MPSKLALFQVMALASWNGSFAQFLPTPNPTLSTPSPTSSEPFASPTLTATPTTPVSACNDELLDAVFCITGLPSTDDAPWSSTTCTTCQEQFDDAEFGFALLEASCNGSLRHTVTEQLLMCQAECYPPDYECSEVQLEATTCSAVEEVMEIVAEESVQCGASFTSGAFHWTHTVVVVAVTWLTIVLS